LRKVITAAIVEAHAASLGPEGSLR
jgi:hypothetical protein